MLDSGTLQLAMAWAHDSGDSFHAQPGHVSVRRLGPAAWRLAMKLEGLELWRVGRPRAPSEPAKGHVADLIDLPGARVPPSHDLR